MRVELEVCVTSVEEGQVAAEVGADSVEVCTWLACGGVTPSSGLVDAVRSAVRIPVRVLVRPTPGGFVYSPGELHAILTDTEIYGGGAMGVVTGGLLADGGPDADLMRSVRKLAPESEITFHRAIDRAVQPLAVLDLCLEFGLERILSSGARPAAFDGRTGLKEMVRRVGDRLIIAAAGGINAMNVVELVETTGVNEVHFAAQLMKKVPIPVVPMSSTHTGVGFETEPDRRKIEGVMNALVKAGLR